MASSGSMPVVVHQDTPRTASVSSRTSRASSAYQPTSTASSECSSMVQMERYRDPSADGNYVDVTSRRGHKGDVVVVNHHKGSNGPREPTPSYSHASSYPSTSGIGSRR